MMLPDNIFKGNRETVLSNIALILDSQFTKEFITKVVNLYKTSGFEIPFKDENFKDDFSRMRDNIKTAFTGSFAVFNEYIDKKIFHFFSESFDLKIKVCFTYYNQKAETFNNQDLMLMYAIEL